MIQILLFLSVAGNRYAIPVRFIMVLRAVPNAYHEESVVYHVKLLLAGNPAYGWVTRSRAEEGASLSQCFTFIHLK